MTNFDTRGQQERNILSRFRTLLTANRLLVLLTGGGILWFILVTIPVLAPMFTLSLPDGTQEILLPNLPGGTQQIPLGEAPNGKIKIAFVSDRDGYNNVFVMSADGTGVRKLTHSTTEGEYTLDWSPDGEKIAFIRRDLGNYEASIYVMNADGSGQERLTDDALAFSQLKWSPDGKKIAFSRSDGAGIGDIYVINADGSGQSRLTSPTGEFEVYVGTPVWSPDGEKIAYTQETKEVTNSAAGSAYATAPVEAMSGIYMVDADRLGETNLTNATSSSILAWSPDGQKIAFTQPSMDYNDIFVMNSDGSYVTDLTSTPANESAPAWSPDGEKIAFTRDGADTGGIFVMNSDGSDQTRLTDGWGSGGTVSWSPDGEKILLFGPDATGYYLISHGVCVINADGSDERCPVDFADDVSSASVVWTRAQ